MLSSHDCGGMRIAMARREILRGAVRFAARFAAGLATARDSPPSGFAAFAGIVRATQVPAPTNVSK